jgi:protein tyrosine phosphatase (PTP) superfamily phosphohydrolase (DUF442 family)
MSDAFLHMNDFGYREQASMKRVMGCWLVIISLLGCGRAPPGGPAAPSPIPDSIAGEQPGDRPGVHHLMHAAGRFYTGGEPHGEAGFATLARLGFKTIVSVDGARPQVELARQHGLRYVHIPIGYDGIDEDAGLALARLARDTDGEVFIHCHHGNHRGPAAAAVACIAAGAVSADRADDILARAGASRDYAGLWRDVAAYRPPAASATLPELVEVAEVESLAAAMAQIDRSHDHLKLCDAVGWSVPADHPDLSPSQQALLLREALHEAGRHLSGEFSSDFREQLRAAEAQAQYLEDALKSGRRDDATLHFANLRQACQTCHARFRN